MIKHSGHLRTLEKCRKHLPAGRVFYISIVFLNARCVLSHCNTGLRLLYLLIIKRPEHLHVLWFVKNLSSTAAFAIRRVTYFMKVTDCNFFGFNGVTSPLRMLACKGRFESLSITRLRVVIYGSFSCAPKTFCIGLLLWSKLKVENAVNC